MRATLSSQPRSAWQTWLSRAVLVFIVLLLLSGGGFVAVAESAPGKPLFPLRAAFNEMHARAALTPDEVILLHLQGAEERFKDVQVRKKHHKLNEAAIFWMVGETENLMVALEKYPQAVERPTLERARQLVIAERALLYDLVQTAPLERARRNAETLYQLSDTWLPLFNRLLLLDQTR